jgi:hypothetical protein
MQERTIIKEVRLDDINLIVTIYNRGDNLFAEAYKIKSKATWPKPEFHYHFSSEERRNNFISEFIERRRQIQAFQAERREARRAERKAFVHDVKVGDYFAGSWGYDQTQYSVYRVVEVKGKYVIVEGMNSWSHLKNGTKRCLVQKGYNDGSYIKIDEVITAYHDKDYQRNKSRYEEQNLYTDYHGR